MYSHAVQLVSTVGKTSLNELRTQVARRHQVRTAHPGTPTGIAITINGGTVNGVNNNIGFGAPTGDGEDFYQRVYQVLDNFTYPADIFPSSRFYREDLSDPPLELTSSTDGIPSVRVRVARDPANCSQYPERLVSRKSSSVSSVVPGCPARE